MYKAVHEAVGGDNKEQFFCMIFPGTILAPEIYKFDYKNQAPKSPSVMANESKLVNKLFDACFITGADNGRSLPQMYQSALDMLTPKLNAKIAETKNHLRELLMPPPTPTTLETVLPPDIPYSRCFIACMTPIST